MLGLYGFFVISQEANEADSQCRSALHVSVLVSFGRSSESFARCHSGVSRVFSGQHRAIK